MNTQTPVKPPAPGPARNQARHQTRHQGQGKGDGTPDSNSPDSDSPDSDSPDSDMPDTDTDHGETRARPGSRLAARLAARSARRDGAQAEGGAPDRSAERSADRAADRAADRPRGRAARRGTDPEDGDDTPARRAPESRNAESRNAESRNTESRNIEGRNTEGKGPDRNGDRNGGRGARSRDTRNRDTPDPDDPDSGEADAPGPEIAVRPPARPARLQRRHRGIAFSFVLIVLLPLVLAIGYLYLIAEDQYASTAGFTIRTEETGSASTLLTGLGTMLGGQTSGNANVLNAFIQSQDVVQKVHERLDLIAHYSRGWPADPLFSLWPGARIEDLLWFWRRMVLVNFDPGTGLMDIQVRARDPQMAQAIAQAIIDESEAMINDLNVQARRDSMANAERDLEVALTRLRSAREALAAFRARTQIVDPQADIQGRMGVINNLQQQLAQALVDHDLLLQTTAETDPRVRQAMRRIEVINERITQERLNFATQDVTVFDTDYPRLIAQFESLRVDQEFAEQTYRAALTALDVARSNADRQSLYLATFVRPTLAQQAQYPQRLLLSFLTFALLFMIWTAMTLVYYSLRDRG